MGGGMNYTGQVKRLFQFTVGFFLFGSFLNSVQAAFTNLYAFGDGVCTTTSYNPPNPSLFYGHRECNGRVWIEVLAQQQGLPYDPTKNNSFYGQYSSLLVTSLKTNTTSFGTNDLVIVWVCDADFVSDIQDIYPSVNLTTWNTAINQSLTNHFNIITNLYAKGVRALVMPNAVDLTEVPQYNQIVSTSDKSFVRGRVNYFNTNLIATLNQVTSAHPDFKIYVPDVFTLLDNVISNAAFYGLTNALYNGQPIDAYENLGNNAATNGPGTNYIFWDQQDPTAKMHSVIADVVQQQISPVKISQITAFTGSNRLDLVNVPVGQNGLVLGRTNMALGNWTTNGSYFISSNTTQSVFVPASSPGWFYRLRFPYSWSWP